MLAVATIAVLVVAMSYVGFRWPGSKRVIEGVSVIVIDDGKLVDEVIAIERLTREEVMSAAREQGIADIADVRFAVLEPDGAFAFVRYDRHEHAKPHERQS